MTLPTNRPFFANFLAAFRAQSALKTGAAAASTSSTPSAFAQSSAATTATSTLTVSASAAAAAAAAAAAGALSLSAKASSSSSTSASASTSSGSGPSTAPLPIASGAGKPAPFQPARQHATSPKVQAPPPYHSPLNSMTSAAAASTRARRGSDSSNEGGFRDVAGGDRWYVGGRAPNGEERFYKLSVVKRPSSLDRLSMDRLSL